MTQNEFISKLKEKVENIGKGYTLSIDENRGLIHINGDNHICMSLDNGMVTYHTVGGSRICYAERETFEDCLSNIDGKMLTNDEIDELYRKLFNAIKGSKEAV